MFTADNKAETLPPLVEASDEELLQLSKEQNFDAFEELVKRYEGRIYRLCLRILRSPEDAEDILQKTFLSVFENMGSFRGESKFSTWIFRIATNHALMKLRKEKGRELTSIDAPIEFNENERPLQIANFSPDAYKWYEKKEFYRLLDQAVSELPEIYRLVFILRDVEGFSNLETAKMLNLSVPAVKSRALRARLYLRDKLEKHLKGVEKNE